MVTVFLSLGGGMARNTIFSWPLLQTIKDLIMIKNNTLSSGILGEQFNLEMMVVQRAKESPKTLEGIPFLLPFEIPETQNNTEVGGSMDITVLPRTIINQCQILGQN